MIDKRIVGEKPKSFKIFFALKRIFNAIITLIFVPIFVISILMLVQTLQDKNSVPNVFGYKFFVITSGSMEPNIRIGDFIVVKEVEASDLQTNDIISFKEDGVVVTHRIIDLAKQSNEYQFTTKGDNNNVKDEGLVLKENLEGKYQFTIPLLGQIVMFAQKPLGLLILVSIPILLTLINYKINDIVNAKEMERKNKRIAYTQSIEKQNKGEDKE